MSQVSQKFDLRQTQNLVMTPQLQQAIKLLQLTNVELTEFLEEEMQQNPLLEKKDDDADRDDGSNDQDASGESESRDEIQDEFDQAWEGDEVNTSDMNTYEPSSDSMASSGKGGDRNFEDRDDNFDNRISSTTSLRDHLLEQLRMNTDDPRDIMIGSSIIDLLDEQGYLRHETSELVERLQCSEDRLEKLLKIMKGFDPGGIFAKDLVECLSIQLEDNGQLDEYMQRLLDNLDAITKDTPAALAKKCDVSETYLMDMIAEIKALNPRPASDFDHFVVQTVVPDLLMRKIPKDLGGGWRVELNSETLPRVLVNQEYYAEVAQKSKSRDDKTYLNNQLTAANWLVKALHQRAQTMIKVAGEIIEQQDAFFLYGVEFLKPLTLKDVADNIDMHESTVSRVTSNKYIATPRGIFELKYFFSPSIPGANGMMYSAEAVKAQIKNLIEGEDPENILSDDGIVDILGKSGIQIARRTVAKYRELMRIGSSSERKRKKNQKTIV